MPRHDLKGRHVVVTGASSGIGASVATALGRRGAHVGLMARRESELAEVAKAVEAAGGRASYAVTDVTDPEIVAASLARLEAELGPVYGLIANAGVGEQTRRPEISLARDSRTLAVNVMGVLHALAAAQPGMLERREGFLSAVSSLAAWVAIPGGNAYGASKAAVSSYMKALRSQMVPYGVTVTTVHPGFVATPMTAVNKNPMPFMVKADKAGEIIVRGLERGHKNVNFPWPMVVIVKLARFVPEWLLARAMGIKAR
jgi:short-subunit dehydrogenase